LANLEFARTVEPENTALQAYYERCKTRRGQQLPTLPSTIALELDINPFLRLDSPQVAAAIRSQNPLAQSDVELFAALREWKNRF
jgi:hydroxyacylglutathione hydrolase